MCKKHSILVIKHAGLREKSKCPRIIRKSVGETYKRVLSPRDVLLGAHFGLNIWVRRHRGSARGVTAALFATRTEVSICGGPRTLATGSSRSSLKRLSDGPLRMQIDSLLVIQLPAGRSHYTQFFLHTTCIRQRFWIWWLLISCKFQFCFWRHEVIDRLVYILISWFLLIIHHL